MSVCGYRHFHFHLKCPHLEVQRVLETENDHKLTAFAETSGESLKIENQNNLAFLYEALALM